MENPFEIILAEIKVLQNQMSEILQRLDTPKYDREFIPATEIIKTYIGRSTFYQFIREGKFHLYKLGDKSFVKSDEFFRAFRQVALDY